MSKVNINGILLFDKPVGLSSNAILQKIKKLFNAKKAGHTGSLDPIASGMLPICFGEATKFSQFLLNSDKSYDVKIKLGIQTTTGDVEGSIIARKEVPSLSPQFLLQVLDKFCGKISQIPPMFSALKYQGQPLYQLARKGVVIERQARQIQIFDIQLQSLEEDILSLHVHCSKGTYIRSLAEDIGEALECKGHVISLRRLSCGPYKAEQMHTYDHLKFLANQSQMHLQGTLQPIMSGLANLPVVQLKAGQAWQIRHGQAIAINDRLNCGWVCLTEMDNCFLGVGEVLADGRVNPKRLLKSEL